MNSFKEADVQQLIEGFLACDCMQHRENRNSVVQRLSDNISRGIERKDTAHGDVESIIRRCLKFEDGIEELMDAVEFSERGTIPFSRIKALWQSIKTRAPDDKTEPSFHLKPDSGSQKNVQEATNPSDSQKNVNFPSSDVQKQMPRSTEMEKASQSALWERIAAFSFGVVFVSVMLAIVLFVPNPTPFQYKFFRVVMALAAAGIGAVIPGLLQVEWKTKYMPYIRAAGAFAFFVLVYLLDPPKM